GMEERQFKQIVMIAQGEFLKLLLADSRERSEIFRRVFATDGYRRAQLLLKEEEKRLHAQLEEDRRGLLQRAAGFAPPEESDWRGAWAQWLKEEAVYDLPRALEAAKAMLQEDESALESLKERACLLAPRLKAAHGALERAQQAEQDRRELDENRRAWAQLQAEAPGREQDRFRLAEDRRAAELTDGPAGSARLAGQEAEAAERELQARVQRRAAALTAWTESLAALEQAKRQQGDLAEAAAQAAALQERMPLYRQRQRRRGGKAGGGGGRRAAAGGGAGGPAGAGRGLSGGAAAAGGAAGREPGGAGEPRAQNRADAGAGPAAGRAGPAAWRDRGPPGAEAPGGRRLRPG
ncbi:MAG: hypothetical protein ACLSX2_01145, partial [Christensenellaceae bacterium]